MASTIKVAILDPHAVSRHGMGVLLAQAADEITVTKMMAQVSDLDTGLHRETCDVLLLSDAIPDGDPVNPLLCHMQQRWPEMRIVILSQTLHLGYIQQLLSDGARGFLYKEDRLDEILLLAIRTIMRGEVYLSPKATLLPYQIPAQDLKSLTVRESQVLRLLNNGLTIEEIAKSLHLNIKTVYRSRDKLKDALGARTNEQIVPTAHSRGLL